MTEFRPGGFQLIPPVIKNLVIINVLIYLAQATLGDTFNTKMIDLFALHDVRSPLFRPHQLITYLFLHGGWQHVIYNMFALWMFGSILENYWGPKRFLIFYMICGHRRRGCAPLRSLPGNDPLLQRFTSIYEPHSATGVLQSESRHRIPQPSALPVRYSAVLPPWAIFSQTA